MSDKKTCSVSLCMIVKNEEAVLERCLESLKGLMDEIIIVDTGSTDSTMETALRYTDKVYRFKWVNDFSAARNFAFSRATCDYIYTADADEVIDGVNRERFRRLKENLDPEIEIVQMYYCNQLSNGSVYNFDRELRAKLFKRLRKFTWVDPVHEVIRENPLVFDSDIEIIHLPEGDHSGRDIEIFERTIRDNGGLSKRLVKLYARELMIRGDKESLKRAEPYFSELAENELSSPEELKMAVCVIVYSCFLRGDYLKMYRYALKEAAMEPASEVCFILGEYYMLEREWKEAAIWFYNAAFETECALSVRFTGEYAIKRLIKCYEELGDRERVLDYTGLLKESYKGYAGKGMKVDNI